MFPFLFIESTQNSIGLTGRQRLSKALENRFFKFVLDEYTDKDWTLDKEVVLH